MLTNEMATYAIGGFVLLWGGLYSVAYVAYRMQFKREMRKLDD